MLVLHYRFWLRPGDFAEFARISAEEIWPVFERLGARIQGFYRAERPDPHPDVEGPCEMAVLLTAYTGEEHWQAAARRAREYWGDGPDITRMLAAIERRQQLALATEFTRLTPADIAIGGPYFVPPTSP